MMCSQCSQGVAAPVSTVGRVPAQSPHGPLGDTDLPWGFARGMPSLDELFAAAAASRGDASEKAADPSGGDPAGRDQGTVAEAIVAAVGSQSLYMRRLQESRAFHCPDATECMAEALGAKDVLQGLQVGAMQAGRVPCHMGVEVPAWA